MNQNHDAYFLKLNVQDIKDHIMTKKQRAQSFEYSQNNIALNQHSLKSFGNPAEHI